MSHQPQCCHHLDCPARGNVGPGNMRICSHKEQRYQCTLWGTPCVATRCGEVSGWPCVLMGAPRPWLGGSAQRGQGAWGCAPSGAGVRAKQGGGSGRGE